MTKRRITIGLAAAALVAPTTAQAGTVHWASGEWLGSGQGLYNALSYSALTGAYCHEMDPVNTRQIQINAMNWNGTALWGSWVQYTTDGLRSYSGWNHLRGACKNPHSLGYSFNAHDNHIDA